MANQQFIDAMQALQDISEQVAVPMKGGKTYVMVKDRIEIFRREFGDKYGITTTVDYNSGFDQGAPIVASAQISDSQGLVVASGWAVEFVGSTKLTDASPVEVAETSAIGRALACFGLAGGEYASFDEMQTHERKQEFRQASPVGRQGPSETRQGNGGRQIDPGLARQVERNRQQMKQPEWYVPSDHDAFWLQPEEDTQRIVDEIENITTTHELGKYWSDLKGFVDIIKKDEVGKDVIAEIKAAFATRHNTLGAQR